MKSNSKITSFLTGLALVSASASSFAAVGDGPRAYQPGPVGTKRVTFMPMHQNSSFNIDGSPSEPAARVKADILAVQYTQIMDFTGRTAALFGLLPLAEISAELLDTPVKVEESGVGDVVVGGILSLVGAPAMTPKEFAAFKPGFTAGVVGKLTLPTGSYDRDNALNIGTNRWAFQLGGITSWYLGEGLTAGKVTSIEVTPSVTFYGDNDSPPSGDRLKQKPMYSLGVNLTHDFNSQFWGSIDSLYTNGGEGETDGQESDADTEKFLLGVSVGTYLPQGFGLQLNYGQTLKNDSDGYDDHLVRIKISKNL